MGEDALATWRQFRRNHSADLGHLFVFLLFFLVFVFILVFILVLDWLLDDLALSLVWDGIVGYVHGIATVVKQPQARQKILRLTRGRGW